MPFNQGGGGSSALSGVVVSGTAAAGQVPVASSSSAGAWAYPPGFEIGYTQITATVNITDTAEATATALISPGALTFDGGAVMFEFFGYSVLCDTAGATDIVTFTLFEGATQITRLGVARTIATAAPNANSVSLKYRFTPTAASHTYKLCAFVTSTTGTPNLGAGAGGTNAASPSFVRFAKV